MIDKLKLDLPNFPEEIIRTWIGPHAKRVGWPPITGKEWNYLVPMDMDDLESLKKIVWEEVEMPAEELIGKMSRSYASGLELMEKSYFEKENNQFSKIENGKKRCHRAMLYILQHGKMPEAPILFQDIGGLTVLDGNHRVLALKVVADIEKILGVENAEREASREKIQEIFKIDSIKELDKRHRFWVGRT